MTTNSGTLRDESQPTASKATLTGATTAPDSGLELDSRQHDAGLEVDGSRHFSDDSELVRNHYSDLEVAPSHSHGQIEGLHYQNLQAYHPNVPNNRDSHGLMPYHPGVSKDAEAPIFDEKDPPSSAIVANTPRRICGLRPRNFWILMVVLLLVVIGAAVGGGVGATLGSSKNSESDSSSSNDNSSSSSGNTANSTSTSATQDPMNGIRTDSSLAAIAWRGSGSQYQYRVFYQGDRNALKQSSYDSATGSWTVSTLVQGSQVADATSIAATSSKNDSNEQYVFYYDSNLEIQALHLASTTITPLSVQSEVKQGTTPKLAAYFLDCDLCPNSILLAYTSSNRLLLSNYTTGQITSPVSTITLRSDATDDSSLAFQPYSISGYADQLNLYYQRSDRQLVLSSWFSAQYQADRGLNLDSTNGWQSNGDNGVVTRIVQNASLSVTYLGDNNGSPAVVEALSTAANSSELQVTRWSNNAWESSGVPSALTGLSEGTAIATHWLGRAYAIRDGILTQFSLHDDGVTWSVQSSVPTS